MFESMVTHMNQTNDNSIRSYPQELCGGFFLPPDDAVLQSAGCFPEREMIKRRHSACLQKEFGVCYAHVLELLDLTKSLARMLPSQSCGNGSNLLPRRMT